MFSIEERDRVRARLLARAEADDGIVGAAFTGSQAEPELRRALAATINIAADELERSDPLLATRLRPMLADLCA